jgi:hypothetical protein
MARLTAREIWGRILELHVGWIQNNEDGEMEWPLDGGGKVMKFTKSRAWKMRITIREKSGDRKWELAG